MEQKSTANFDVHSTNGRFDSASYRPTAPPPRKPDRIAPKVKSKEIAEQLEFNTKLINLLQNWEIEEDKQKIIEEVRRLLEERNQRLVFLELCPDAIEQYDRLKAMSAAISEISGGSASAPLAAAMAVILTEPSRKRKSSPNRHPAFYERQPFHGGTFATGGAPDARKELENKIRDIIREAFAQINKCYKCGIAGHFSADCRR